MQPRKDLFPRLLIISHVIKRGYSTEPEDAVAGPLLRDRALGRENKEDLEEDLDVAPSVVREGVLDAAEGTEEEEAVEGDLSRRLIAAG